MAANQRENNEVLGGYHFDDGSVLPFAQPQVQQMETLARSKRVRDQKPEGEPEPKRQELDVKPKLQTEAQQQHLTEAQANEGHPLQVKREEPEDDDDRPDSIDLAIAAALAPVPAAAAPSGALSLREKITKWMEGLDGVCEGHVGGLYSPSIPDFVHVKAGVAVSYDLLESQTECAMKKTAYSNYF